MPPDETEPVDDSGPDWSDAELDHWFENDFGGDQAFNDFYFDGGGLQVSAEDHPDLHFGMTAYRQLVYDTEREQFDEMRPWPLLSHEAKMRFRRGWENTQATAESVAEELAPYDAMKTLVDARHKSIPSKPSLPRWVLVLGGFGIVGIMAMVWFLVSGGDTDDAAVTLPAESTVADTALPTTEAIGDDTAETAVAVDAPSLPVTPFPTHWSYTATKAADLIPAPEFITPAPVGSSLPWTLEVVETCSDDGCAYATAIVPLFPDSLLTEVPRNGWEIEGAEWSLDTTYQTVQTRNADGTVCVIRIQDTFELVVTEDEIGDRSVPVTFSGTWVQTSSLDLGASTGNVDLYCGEAWEFAEEWSLEGVATN